VIQRRPGFHRVALAVNPTAGRGRGARAGDAVRARLAGDGIDVQDLVAGSAAELTALAREAVETRVDALVVVGGDGMVHLGCNVVCGTSIPLGIVAAGTGNDIARGLGLTIGDPARAVGDLIAAIESDTVHPMDAARCRTLDGDRWFAGVLAAGFDALVNERANGWLWPRGHLRYDLAILRELPVLRPRDYRLELDGVPWQTPAVMVVVANGTSYGGGMRICPDASTDDGLLDVLVVLPLSRTALLRIYPRVYAGTHLGDSRVLVRRARRVEVAAAGIVAYADGERICPLPLSCEAVPGALHVLVPPATGHEAPDVLPGR
jgi:diacylglycerol kinase (ATP)